MTKLQKLYQLFRDSREQLSDGNVVFPFYWFHFVSMNKDFCLSTTFFGFLWKCVWSNWWGGFWFGVKWSIRSFRSRTSNLASLGTFCHFVSMFVEVFSTFNTESTSLRLCDWIFTPKKQNHWCTQQDSVLKVCREQWTDNSKINGGREKLFFFTQFNDEQAIRFSAYCIVSELQEWAIWP